MNALEGHGQLQVSDKGMIWNSDLVETLELQNCMITATRSSRGRGQRGE